MGKQKKSARGRGFQSGGPFVPFPHVDETPQCLLERAAFAESTEVYPLLTTRLANGPTVARVT